MGLMKMKEDEIEVMDLSSQQKNNIFKQLQLFQAGYMLATEKNRDVIEQIKKLMERIDIFVETKSKLFEYLIKMQQVFVSNSKEIKMQVQKFEAVIMKKSLYSIGKCHSMKKFGCIYNHMLTFVGGVAEVNKSDLQKIEISNSRLQQNLKSKGNKFIKILDEYCHIEILYNKNFGQYEQQCGKLDEMVSKLKSFENPINFYNINNTSEFSKNLDKKYGECQNKQTTLISSLQLLDEKRKLMTENLKDIKSDYLELINCHMDNISKAAVCLTDLSKDDQREIVSMIEIDKTKSDVFNEEIQRFDHKYGKCNAQQNEGLFSDLKDFFNDNNCHASITSDERLFLDRCQKFSNTKYQSVEQFIYLQKKFVQQIQTQGENCLKMEKQFHMIQKNIFKSNGTNQFKKRMRKYFGEGIFNMTQLCLLVVEGHRKRFVKIAKIFQSHEQKLKKVLQKKEEELKNFKKRISIILSQYHNIAVTGVQNNAFSISQFKSNVERTFANFKNIFEEFSRNEGKIDRDFEEVALKIISLTQIQFQHSLLKYTLNKQKQKFLENMFKKFSSSTQIIQITKEDTRYEVLFNEPLKPCLFKQFQPRIEKKKFEQTKRILQKKEQQQKGIIRPRSIGCCGIASNRIAKYTKITEHHVSIMYETQVYKPGKLEISNNGLTFEEKNKNLFSKKIKIVIPTKQIISFSNRISSQGLHGIEIVTNMGLIFFFSQEVNEIQNSLEKNLDKRIMSKNDNDFKRDKSNDSSSLMKQNNTSTEYKISFDRSLLINRSKSFLGKKFDEKSQKSVINLEATPFEKLMEVLEKTIVLSDLFTVMKTYTDGNSVRSDYKYQGELNKFILKERRTTKIQQTIQNVLNLYYEWKVSFPNMTMLKSFGHEEKIRVELTKNQVNIVVTEKNRGDRHLFAKKTFYNEVDRMNKKLSDVVAEVYELEGKMIIQQEQQQIQESTIILDVENLALDRDQVESRYEKGLKKTPSAALGIQSEKSIMKGLDN